MVPVLWEQVFPALITGILFSLQKTCFKNRDFPLHSPCSNLHGIAVHVYKFYMASNDPSVKCPPWFWRALASLVLHPEWRQGPASTRKSSKMSPRQRLAVTATPHMAATASPTRRAATIRSIRHWRDYDRYIEIVAARAARAPPMRRRTSLNKNHPSAKKDTYPSLKPGKSMVRA